MATIDPTHTDRDDVEELADAFLDSYRSGRRPTVDEFVDRFPRLAGELHGLLKAIMILEQNSPSEQIESPVYEMTAAEGLPRQIGDFVILRQIGRGGMGVVYEAVQQSLNRHVALKVLSLPGLLNPGHLERFRREAQAAARLQHGNIVPVYEFGATGGTYYYAMQYVPGKSLDVVIRLLRENRSNAHDAQVDRNTAGSIVSAASAYVLNDIQFSISVGRKQLCRNLARIGLQAAEALAYAHGEGILHRDIKPSNLLLDTNGNVWILDFGLARADGDDDLTHTGDLVGTLRYTAPERLEGWSDRSSDIYGLGATLYELLTLQPLFASTSRGALLRRIAEDTPLAPRRVDGLIPVDLETIVLKAIAKEPAARYHRAEHMAEDLRRFLADRPILARRSSVLERFGRWCRRNPTIALLSTSVVALLVAAIVILALSNSRIRRESAAREAALKDRAAAITDKDEAVGKIWLYRGLYGIDDDQAATLQNFDKALALSPNKADVLWLRGFTLGGWGRWDEAVADMTKARSSLGNSKLISPACRDWFVASLYLAKGDRAIYQAACREALDRIPSKSNLDERGILLWMCTVTPDAIGDSSRLVEASKLVLPGDDNQPTGDRLLDVGAAFIRAGQLRESQIRLKQSLKEIAGGSRTEDPMAIVFAHLFLSMADSRLGLAKEATLNLDEAARLSKTIRPPCWVSKLQFKLLTDEAQRVVRGSL